MQQAISHPNSPITGFVLKILAIVGMTSNHLAHVFGGMMPWQATLVFYWFGGITYPSMAYLLVEGYIHTSNLRRYATRLALFAVVSQVPFTLCFGWGDFPIPRLNVLVTLLIGLGLLWAHDHAPNKLVALGAFLAALVLSYFCDWGISGVILLYLFYLLRGKGALGALVAMAFLYVYILTPNVLDIVNIYGPKAMQSANNALVQGIASRLDIYYIAGIPIHFYNELIGSLANIGYAVIGFTIATVFICMYNGKRGRSMKWFFYAYYPAHMLLLWAIHEVMTKM